MGECAATPILSLAQPDTISKVIQIRSGTWPSLTLYMGTSPERAAMGHIDLIKNACSPKKFTTQQGHACYFLLVIATIRGVGKECAVCCGRQPGVEARHTISVK